MNNLTGSMKDVAFATSPREFDLSYSTTLEEIMQKLNARRAAFQMPFQDSASRLRKNQMWTLASGFTSRMAHTFEFSRSLRRLRCRLAVCALIRTAHCARA